MFCINCGKELPPKAKFCPNCGTPVFAYNSANNPKDEDKRKKASTGLENGHEWVDLGLSVKWATCDIGANSPEDYGSRFAWGEVSPKHAEAWEGYRFLPASRNFIDPLTIPLEDTSTKRGKRNLDLILEMEDYISLHLTKYNKSDGITRLDLSDDAACVNWGGRWRMPSMTEFGELRARCLWTWTKLGGKDGYKVTGTNGNSIFLPADRNARGLFWTSDLGTPYDHIDAKSYVIENSPGKPFGDVGFSYRCFILAIRPVLDGLE